MNDEIKDDDLGSKHEEDPELGFIKGIPNITRWKAEECFSGMLGNLKKNNK